MRLPLATALFVGLCACPAWAETAAHKAGLPQLDPQWFASQVFWLAVHFLVLYVVAARFILPGISQLLEAREARVTEDMARAKTLSAEAKQVKRAYEVALAEARAKANAAREASMAEGATERRWAEETQAEELARRISAAHVRITTESAAMRSRMRDIAAEATTDLVKKLTGVAVTRDVVDGAMGRLLDVRLKEGP